MKKDLPIPQPAEPVPEAPPVHYYRTNGCIGMLVATMTGLLLPLLALFPGLAISAPDPTPVLKTGVSIPISLYGVEFIQRHETGGKAYYTKRLTGVEWPGGASGPTIGVGFDLGYNSRAQIQTAWQGVASPAELSALLACAGVTGSKAKALASRYRRAVHFTWEEAQVPFVRDTLPRFTAQTKAAFRLSDKLHPHSNAALTSLVFNRGPSMSGNSRRHMVQIRDLLAGNRVDKVPQIFMDMRVLWQGKGLDGLLTRRKEEAELFSSGISLRKKYP